jgi:hypothetical protein
MFFYKYVVQINFKYVFVLNRYDNDMIEGRAQKFRKLLAKKKNSVP